jgi:intraflagellar transport protein 122
MNPRLQGRYDDAADLFSKAGATDRALEMWSDLRQFDKATKWAAQAGAGGQQAVEKLLQKQAQWNEEVRDYRAAAEMYMSTGKHDKAMLLLSKHTTDWAYLLEIARKLDRYAALACNCKAAQSLLMQYHDH